MLRGIDTIANGMNGVLHLNDAIANDMANINSTGFKKTKLVFQNIQEVAIEKANGYENEDSKKIGSISLGSEVARSVVDFSQGTIKTTGNALDLAIDGNGFFKVQNEQGENLYTRNGKFMMNTDGNIVNADGYKLVGQGGVIQTAMGNETVGDINITSDGYLQVGRQKIDILEIEDFDDRQQLEQINGSLFKLREGSTATAKTAENYSVVQGALEGSNANMIETMLSSINASRSYETLSKVINMHSQSLQQTISKVGSIRS